VANRNYPSIYFSGAAFYLPFHFGAIKCLKDNNISFDKAYGVSSGAQAALAILNGSDLELGIRQCFDLCDQTKYLTTHWLFNSYSSYFQKYRSNSKRSLKDLSGRLHVGLFDLKTMRSFFHSNFESEEDLKQIISSSGNIVPFMSLAPNVWNDMWLLDTIAFVDSDPEHSVMSLSVTPFAYQGHLPESAHCVVGSAVLSPLGNIL
jgi:hypothetical protein